jgi:hypothetical protein
MPWRPKVPPKVSRRSLDTLPTPQFMKALHTDSSLSGVTSENVQIRCPHGMDIEGLGRQADCLRFFKR